jgi:serine/threonine protein kinase
MPSDAGGAQTFGERDKVSDETRIPGEFGVGSQVASYRLDEILGRGGMAVVYRAFDTRLQRRVAMKILSPDLARDQEFRHRFIRESQAAAAVDHPNIIPIFEAGQFGSVLFIAMRFVEGRDVHSIIAQDGHLSVARTCSIVTQVAAALDAAHAHGLVHRDVKPANMLREPAEGSGRADHVYLSDFGLSKRSFASTGLTSKGHFLGTLNYIAPEQIEGKMVDGRADQYALACSAFEMLSGMPPFKRDETLAIMWAQISASPPAVTSMRPGLPGAVDPVLARALAKAPAERYQTCLEFAAALRRACGLEAGPAVPESAAPDHPRTRPVNLADLAAAAAATPPASPPAASPASPPAGPPLAPQVSPPGAQPAGPPAAPLVPQGAAQPVPPGGVGAPPQADIPTVRPGGMGPPTQAATLPSLGGRAPGVGSPPWPTQPEYTEPPQPPPRSSRRAWIAVVIAGVVVVAAVGAYLLAGHGGGSGNKPPSSCCHRPAPPRSPRPRH